MVRRHRRRQLGFLFWVGLPGPVLDAATGALLRRLQPGGIILLSHNIKTQDQLAALIRDVKLICNRPPIIAVDEEGGRVQRLASLVGRLPPWASWHQNGCTLRHIYHVFRAHAQALAALGLGMNLAPVVDIGFNGSWMTRLERCAANHPHCVRSAAATLARALQAAGIMACYKHFPGLGRGHLDTHTTPLHISVARHALTRCDLVPYRDAAYYAPAVMLAHAIYPAIDPDLPSSLSPRVVSLLRRRYHFPNLVLTDDLSMGAIANCFPLRKAVTYAVAAGVDGILVCHDLSAAVAAHNYLATNLTSHLAARVSAAERRYLATWYRYATLLTTLPNLTAFAAAVNHLARHLRALEKTLLNNG